MAKASRRASHRASRRALRSPNRLISSSAAIALSYVACMRSNWARRAFSKAGSTRSGVGEALDHCNSTMQRNSQKELWIIKTKGVGWCVRRLPAIGMQPQSGFLVSFSDCENRREGNICQSSLSKYGTSPNSNPRRGDGRASGDRCPSERKPKIKRDNSLSSRLASVSVLNPFLPNHNNEENKQGPARDSARGQRAGLEATVAMVRMVIPTSMPNFMHFGRTCGYTSS